MKLLLFLVLMAHQVCAEENIAESKYTTEKIGSIIYDLISSPKLETTEFIIAQMLFSSGSVKVEGGKEIPVNAIALTVIDELYGKNIIDDTHPLNIEIVGVSRNGFRYRYTIINPNPGEIDRVRAKLKLGFSRDGLHFP